MQLRKTSTREFLKTAILQFLKTHSCLFIRSCTRNYTVIYVYLPSELELSEKFDTKIELICGRLLPWYQDNDMVVIFFVRIIN